MGGGFARARDHSTGAAEAGVTKIGDVLHQMGQGEGIGFEEQTIGEVSWQTIVEPQSQQVFGGYGFAKDELVIAFGKGSLESAGGKETVTAGPATCARRHTGRIEGASMPVRSCASWIVATPSPRKS